MRLPVALTNAFTIAAAAVVPDTYGELADILRVPGCPVERWIYQPSDF
jgi:hypothetical protein